MIKNNLVVYNNLTLYKILSELESVLSYKITHISKKKDLKNKDFLNSLILTNSKFSENNNQLILSFPLKITKLTEKINIEILKSKTKENSSIFIGSYEINLNSRILKLKSHFVNLTEKEINLIMFLNNSTSPIKATKLQSEVWHYGSNLETHTVETHIHRLRKKILQNLFKDDLILSNKKGYYLKK